MISTKEATTITSRGDVYVNGNESVSVTGNVVTVNGKTIKLNSQAYYDRQYTTTRFG